MKKGFKEVGQVEHVVHGTLQSYIVGFILSIALTFIAFWLVSEHLLQGWPLIFTISALAVVQVIVQLLFFLHLGIDSRPPWNLITFLFMIVVMAILVIGSLWIMYNLDYYMMVPS